MSKHDQNPLVSIWIPVYNGADLIDRAIKSCLNQTYKNIEVIVFDDSSTDNTEQVVKKYPVKYHKTNKRLGLIRSIPKILELCNGEYVHLLSHDDWLQEDFIKEMVKSFTSFLSVGAILPKCFSVEDSEVTNIVELKENVYTKDQFGNMVYRSLIHDLIVWGMVRKEDAIRAAQNHINLLENPPSYFPQDLINLTRHEYGHDILFGPSIMSEYEYLVYNEEAVYFKSVLPIEHYMKHKGSMGLREKYGLTNKTAQGILKSFYFRRLIFEYAFSKDWNRQISGMKVFFAKETISTIIIQAIKLKFPKGYLKGITPNLIFKGYSTKEKILSIVLIIPRLISRFIDFLRRL